MVRHILLLDLKDDPSTIAAYERSHATGAVPPAVLASIRRAGILNMEIHRAGNRLVMIMDTSAEFDPAAKAAADAADPDVCTWEALMETYQKPIPCAEPGNKWIEAARIFSLADQP